MAVGGSRPAGEAPAEKEQALEEPDSDGFVSRLCRALVPATVARLALSVSVAVEGERYERGEPVEFTVVVRNRLPVPVRLEIDGKLLWGWRVDGLLEASDEPRYVPEDSRALELDALEARRFEQHWDGRFKRAGDPDRWIDPDPGEHEIEAFVATAPPVTGSARIRIA